MVVTDKVAERLKQEFVDACGELGAEFLAIMYGNKGGKDGLRQQIIERCYEFGVGFRVMGGTDDDGRTIFNIKLDNKNAGDEVVDASGLRIFLDPVSAVHLRDYELDCLDGGFFLRERQGVVG